MKQKNQTTMYEELDDFNDVIHVSDQLRCELMTEHIQPYYKKLIVELLNARSFYKRFGMLFETTSKLCIAVSSILSFSTGYSTNNTQYFAATSGSIGCLSLGLMQIASYAYKEQVGQSTELNTVLKKLRLETIPVGRHGSIVTSEHDCITQGNQNTRRGSIFEPPCINQGICTMESVKTEAKHSLSTDNCGFSV